MTNDVESFSIQLNKLDSGTAKEVYKIGLPRLLDIYAKHDIKSTFYFTGEIAELVPESVDLVIDHGHDIGCHGYNHLHNSTFDSMPLDEQIKELKKAKYVLEDIAGKVTDFRAPALRINENTIHALEKTGFNTDSSVASQRFDGPFTFGSKRKVKWLIAPRNPYYPSYNSIFRKGYSNILEIPISAFILSYIGTTLRLNSRILRILEKFLFIEANQNNKPIVFIMHPNECLDSKGGIIPEKRTNNYLEHIFADTLRYKLKNRNLGTKALELLDDLIIRAKTAGFEFVTVSEYCKLVR